MNIKTKSRGFLQTIIIIVIAIFLLSYFNVTIQEAFAWFIAAVKNVF